MAVNTMTFEQSAAFLQDLYEQATGQKAIAVTDTGTFTTVGTTLLQMGYDQVTQSLTQLLARSIYSIRPYSQKFKSLNVTEEKWGAVVRKINYIDSDIVNDDSLSLVDGQSADQWEVRKPKILQTNFYGAHNYSDFVTIYTYQLDAALRDAAEFGRWLAGVLQNIADKLTQIEEAEARSLLINFITSKFKADTPNAINVLQAYYDETGVTLTPSNMFAQANYPDFVKWLYGYINTLTDMMSERSVKYHMNITGKELMRHTGMNFMKAFMSANVLNKTASEVLATVFNPDKLKMVEFEKVNFWQNMDSPYSVTATPTYLNVSNGQLITETTPVGVDNVIGCLFDVEALGTCRRLVRTERTPINARMLTYNIWYHFQQATWNDFTENFVLLYADTVTP